MVRERWPSLAAMERNVANLRVRNVGTIGGNLCFADPHSDPATYLIAADGSLTLRRGGAEPRRIPAEELTRGPYMTALEPEELLVSVHVPAPATGEALVHRKLAFHERPAITVAARVTVRDGALTKVRLAVGSIGAAAQRLGDAEQIATGADALAPERRQLEAVAAAAARQARPTADANGSVEYKRQLVRVSPSDASARRSRGRWARWQSVPAVVAPHPAADRPVEMCRSIVVAGGAQSAPLLNPSTEPSLDMRPRVTPYRQDDAWLRRSPARGHQAPEATTP